MAYKQAITELYRQMEQMEAHFNEGEFLKAAHLQQQIRKGIEHHRLQVALKLERLKAQQIETDNIGN